MLSLIREGAQVPYEPLRFLFFGEEAFQLARMWMAGWDAFAPPASVVFHQWTRAGRHTFQAEVPQARLCVARYSILPAGSPEM